MNTSNLFAPYAENLRKVVNKAQQRTELTKGFSALNGLSGMDILTEVLSPNKPVYDRSLFNQLAGHNLPFADPRYDNSSSTLGSHPDFQHLRSPGAKPEKHYITTMFIDIRNSTRLYDTYEPEVVAAITIGVQTLALHICWLFGGYVHRLQGDGLMVYFGGKRVSKEVSIQQALHAASFFTYFIKYDLPNVLSSLKLEKPLYTRIGIDFGEDKDVAWYLAGIGNCSEVTTSSLHTSLAPKMQANAGSNGIVVGDNVKTKAPNEQGYFSIVKNADGSDDRYIFRGSDGFLYTQWQFDWWKFLKNHKDVEVDEQGNLRFKPFQPQPKPTGPEIIHFRKDVEDYRPYSRG